MAHCAAPATRSWRPTTSTAAKEGLTRGFGRDSSDALAARLSQALNWLAPWERRQARTAAEEVLAVYEGRLGPDHPHSLICRLNISTALYLEEDYSAAENEVRSVAAGLKERAWRGSPIYVGGKYGAG